MAVDRISVTVPTELGDALRALAEARGETMSSLVSQAIAHQLRLAALDDALAEADLRFGAVPEEAIRVAERELLDTNRPRRRSRSTSAA